MPTTLKQLLIIQDGDRKIAKLNRETQDIPARKTQTQSRLEEHRQALHSAQEEAKKKELSLKDLEGEVETIKGKIAKLREQQFEVKSNEAYRTLEKEIDVFEKKINTIEEQELTVIESLELLQEDVAKREHELKEEDELISHDLKMLDERVTMIAQELEKVKTDRVQKSAEVDATWLNRYERIFKHTGNYAIVSVQNSICAGCHMKLPPQVIHDARAGVKMTLCNYCGRILYVSS